ncbi:MAG: transcriptional regulator [Lachnospiraceae bacterium]|nr:transcriptional regulator [Lachnospiraceae bacterium]
MKQGIGEVLVRLRKESGITQADLREGLCSASELAKIENNQKSPDPFLLDRFFRRLGKSTVRLEYVLSAELYHLYELQYQIQVRICHREYKLAEKLLLEYENEKKGKGKIHRQFITQSRAQIAWLQEKESGEVLKYIEEATMQTVDFNNLWEKGKVLSAEEIRLFLFRWEVLRKAEIKGKATLAELWKIVEYIEYRQFEPEELAKIYPYAVLLLNKYGDGSELKTYCTAALENALELLREEGKILYLPEILEACAEIYAKNEKRENHKKVGELLRMRDALVNLELEYGMHFENYRLFSDINRRFKLDYEMIRQNRLACGMTMEELCDGICTWEELSRIERGKCKPNDKTFEKLMEKMNRKRGRIEANITTEDYEVILLEAEMEKALHRFQYEKAEEFLKDLSKRLELNYPENCQYLETEKVRIEVSRQHLTFGDGIQRLISILENILTLIARLYQKWNRKEQAVQILEKLLTNYEASSCNPAFMIREWGLVLGNLAGLLEELGDISKPIELCRKRLNTALSAGQGRTLGRSVTIIACVLERKEKDFVEFYDALRLLKLMKMDYRFNCVVDYIKKNGYVEFDEEAV